MEKDIVKSSDNELWMDGVCNVRAQFRASSGSSRVSPLQQPSQHSSSTTVGTYRSVADLSGSKESIVIATIESLRATQNKN